MHIVEANDWKDAAITLLEPLSPYRPWRCGPEPLHAEERVLAVLHTDPVLTTIGYANADGNATFGRDTALDLLGMPAHVVTHDLAACACPTTISERLV